MSSTPSSPRSNVSPTSTGPAGATFEAQVGASYLLALLLGAEPRGLPGALVQRVKFQGAAEGWPVDDVVVHATDPSGSVTLEIQVKREVTFAPGDRRFLEGVQQIATACRTTAFWDARRELAIATAKTSHNISGPYQDVLLWARDLDRATFFQRIRGFSETHAMRSFVQTFQTRLAEVGGPDDDESLWKILRRFQILFFDFGAPGSANESLARERATRALEPEASADAGALWTELLGLALRVASSGGERTSATLLQDLNRFRIAEQRRHARALTALAEHTSNALADIGDRVGGVTLLREPRLNQIRSALDAGRYVEIRGDSGVGKSGLLKHLARQVESESRVMVLNPHRTPPGGWLELRNRLGFDGLATDLLVELAGSGSGILFLDNLERFSEEARVAASDLVRAASLVPGISVVATARTGFGVDEPNWLPADALQRLGQASPTLVDELSQSEVAELRRQAPALLPLLSDDHPAKTVSRNLFRLSRLVATGESLLPRTEIDMAVNWWTTADGPAQNRRERSRLLQALANGIIAGTEMLETTGFSAAAVDELVTTETVRDFGSERVALRHDVLADWAVANVLILDSGRLDLFPRRSLAPPRLARGVELLARHAVEQGEDSSVWLALVERLSAADVHGSWRRAALLALVRSESASQALDKCASALTEDGGNLLRDVIRVVRAVDVVPMAEVLRAAGVDPKLIPSHLTQPHGPAWYRLIAWLVQRGEDLPVQAIPDVVDLYYDWFVGTLGSDALTPVLLGWFHRWLVELDEARGATTARTMRQSFGGQLEGETLRTLEDKLRSAFVMFCNREPSLAVDYLRRLLRQRHDSEAVKSVLKFRGQLAQAAPAELAELTARALIPPVRRERQTRGLHGDIPERPFTWADSDFIPASPAQGPFLELLTHSPAHGIALIRRLVERLVAYYTKGRPAGDNVLKVEFSSGTRTCPWLQSYAWSRGDRSFAVTSGLMALEAWAHRRVENGDDFQRVIDDILGTGEAPAAYLLICVDLVLSHWPESRTVAIPFLACPELLSLDRERLAYDWGPEFPDPFGLKEIQREPAGPVTLASLQGRRSRQFPLDTLLSEYASDKSPDERRRLSEMIQLAVTRLGAHADDSDFRDPAFMAWHALNALDPTNYREVTGPQGVTRRAYVPPDVERVHLEKLLQASATRRGTASMKLAVSAALTDSRRSSPPFAEAVAQWARENGDALVRESAYTDMTSRQVLPGAAMIVMRDAVPEVREAFRPWALQIFRAVLREQEDDPVHASRTGLQFNPLAIAFAGVGYRMDGLTRDDVSDLLSATSRPAASRGFQVVAERLAKVDERLPRSVLRCAFTACIYEPRSWARPDEEYPAVLDRRRAIVQAEVDAEVTWLLDGGPEPEWPVPVGRLRGTRIDPTSATEPIEMFDSATAANWIGVCRRSVFAGERWVQAMVRAFAQWTWTENGAGAVDADRSARGPDEWNMAFFPLLANQLLGSETGLAGTLILDPLASLPAEDFYDVVAVLIPSVDELYFEGGRLDLSIARHVRTRLIERLIATPGWRWHVRGRSTSMEIHLGSALAVLLFADKVPFVASRTYLLPPAMERLTPLLPTVAPLARQPSFSVAIQTLNFLEVSPSSDHLSFLLDAASSWMAGFPDWVEFWTGYGVGRRVCALIAAANQQDASLLRDGTPARIQANELISKMVAIGAPEAAQLERDLLGH